jgi:hypothetical protein
MTMLPEVLLSERWPRTALYHAASLRSGTKHSQERCRKQEFEFDAWLLSANIVSGQEAHQGRLTSRTTIRA